MVNKYGEYGNMVDKKLLWFSAYLYNCFTHFYSLILLKETSDDFRQLLNCTQSRLLLMFLLSVCNLKMLMKLLRLVQVEGRGTCWVLFPCRYCARREPGGGGCCS